MATAIRSGVLAASPGEPCAWPTFEAFEGGLRDVRRGFVSAKHAAEDFAAESALKVRRHPFRAMALAVAAGAAIGAIGTGAISWYARNTSRC